MILQWSGPPTYIHFQKHLLAVSWCSLFVVFQHAHLKPIQPRFFVTSSITRVYSNLFYQRGLIMDINSYVSAAKSTTATLFGTYQCSQLQRPVACIEAATGCYISVPPLHNGRCHKSFEKKNKRRKSLSLYLSNLVQEEERKKEGKKEQQLQEGDIPREQEHQHQRHLALAADTNSHHSNSSIELQQAETAVAPAAWNSSNSSSLLFPFSPFPPSFSLFSFTFLSVSLDASILAKPKGQQMPYSIMPPIFFKV